MPKEVDHDARRDEIARAVWRIILSRGIDAVTSREISRESGFSSGVLTHYFENKEEILTHALRLAHARTQDKYTENLEAPSALAGLRAVIVDALPIDAERDQEMRVELGFWSRVLSNRDLHKIQKDQSLAQRAVLHDLIERAQSEGTISTDRNTEEALRIIVSLIDGVRLRALVYPDRLPPEKQEEMVEFTLGLLG